MSDCHATISLCPECDGSGNIETYSGPHSPRWDPCPECDGTGEHYCECRIDPGCRVHGGDSVRVDMTPEVRARLPRRAS